MTAIHTSRPIPEPEPPWDGHVIVHGGKRYTVDIGVTPTGKPTYKIHNEDRTDISMVVHGDLDVVLQQLQDQYTLHVDQLDEQQARAAILLDQIKIVSQLQAGLAADGA